MNDVVYDGTYFLDHLASPHFGDDLICGWQNTAITGDLEEDGSAAHLSAMAKRKEKKNFCFTNSFTNNVDSVISLKYSIKHFRQTD